MEQNADAGAPVTPVAENKQKGGNGLKIATAIACIVAACGIGFGIYGMMQISDKDSRISELETQIKEKSSDINSNNQSNESINTYKQYSVGDAINFNGESWHIIANSSATDDYVVALKDQVLDELAGKPYYECPEEDDNGINCSMKMSNDYNKSVAKQYFDNIYIDRLGKDNLKEINGYYVRLVTVGELESLGCDTEERSCEEAPSWLMGNLSWTMSPTTETPTNDASKADVYAFGLDWSGKNVIGQYGVGSTLNVRPVINIYKNKI